MSDTSPEVQAIQDEIHRRMTGEQRLNLAIEMSEMTRRIAMARLRSEHPDWTEWELKRELLRYAFGTDPLPPPLR
ncbi:hypothetical protein [Longimicrobium sp.]|uniref:hypothetical protein n=1 Tax=Longimicrobium sp. TaxID=2029185 RepID=UPI002E2F488C|nr:hypothetical protein [Longimicrobium sp.]HEX6040085.1 hypothetical protein [Longimicrobium sp.]